MHTEYDHKLGALTINVLHCLLIPCQAGQPIMFFVGTARLSLQAYGVDFTCLHNA